MSEILDRIRVILRRRNCRFTIGEVEYVMTTDEAATIRNRITEALRVALDEEVLPPNGKAEDGT